MTRAQLIAEVNKLSEIRQVFEAEDFGAEFTPELREHEERILAQTTQHVKGRTR